MTARPVLDVRIGDRLELRRGHPCGARTWRVTRLGADIGVVCEGCGRRVLLERRDLERHFVAWVERGPAPETQRTGDAAPQA